MLIDTHAHLYWDSFKNDLDEVIKRSIEAGVTTIINVGVDIEKSKEALKQTQGKLANIPGLAVYSTIGIHPHEAARYSKNGQTLYDRDSFVQKDIGNDIGRLEKIYHSNPKKVIAVGECGLDFVFKGLEGSEGLEGIEDAKQKQRQLFQAQIDLAKKLNLPLIVHCRDDRSKNPENSECWDEVLKMVGSHPAILHCYSGLPKSTNYILHTLRLRSGQATNLLVSFAATITYPKNGYLREAAKLLPLEKIVLETDSPFLPPQSKRGQRNEPSAVREIAEFIADLKKVSFEEIAHQTTKNVKMMFKL